MNNTCLQSQPPIHTHLSVGFTTICGRSTKHNYMAMGHHDTLVPFCSHQNKLNSWMFIPTFYRYYITSIYQIILVLASGVLQASTALTCFNPSLHQSSKCHTFFSINRSAPLTHLGGAQGGYAAGGVSENLSSGNVFVENDGLCGFRHQNQQNNVEHVPCSLSRIKNHKGRFNTGFFPT